MFPRLLQLQLTSQELSQAWEYLSNEERYPPENLQHLTQEEWYLLACLLNREMLMKEYHPLQ
jgi:hypothetical protein